MEHPMNKWMIWGVFPSFLEKYQKNRFFFHRHCYNSWSPSYNWGLAVPGVVLSSGQLRLKSWRYLSMIGTLTGSMGYYGWWLKSCTTWDVENLVNNGINYLSTGAGFQPSTVVRQLVFEPTSFSKFFLKLTYLLLSLTVPWQTCFGVFFHTWDGLGWRNQTEIRACSP